MENAQSQVLIDQATMDKLQELADKMKRVRAQNVERHNRWLANKEGAREKQREANRTYKARLRKEAKEAKAARAAIAQVGA